METSTKVWLALGATVAAALVTFGVIEEAKKGGSGPLSPPSQTVTLGGGPLTPVLFPSFKANPNQQITLAAPVYTSTVPATYGVLSSNVASSNQSVIAITPLMQQQSSPTNGQLTYAISGPGTTTLSGSYVDNNGVAQNWSVNVTVAP